MSNWLSQKLKNEIETWQSDKTVFVHVPLERKYVSRADAYSQISKMAEHMTGIAGHTNIGLSFEDPINWIFAIVAAQMNKLVTVPIPQEFTTEQIASFVPELDLVLTDSSAQTKKLRSIFGDSDLEEADVSTRNSNLFVLKCKRLQRLEMPLGAAKIIHTSGSTNHPKGVVVGCDGLEKVIQSMLDRVKHVEQIRYASVLPYSLLLEQILGIYMPIFSRGSISILPRSVGAYIGTQTDLSPYLETVKESDSNFAMFPPSFLVQLQKLSVRSQRDPQSYLGNALRIVATGGAPIDIDTLKYFSDSGIEVYQGYGLSENTSVVAWSFPGPNRLGSVGKTLAHNNVRVNENGQVEVSGASLFLGYVTNGSFELRTQEWLNTGDFGYFDNEGYLYISGRNANLIVLSSGRNVEPEWIENAYRSLPGLKDVVVVGHGKSHLTAIALLNEDSERSTVLDSMRKRASEISNQFPEFARIRSFNAFPFKKEFYSVSGRILRSKVLEKCEPIINEIYKESGVN